MMQETEKEKALNVLAGALADVLNDIYGERIGFALFTFPFGEDAAVGDFVSNAERKDMVAFMREIADRLESRQYIPKTIGEA